MAGSGAARATRPRAGREDPLPGGLRSSRGAYGGGHRSLPSRPNRDSGTRHSVDDRRCPRARETALAFRDGVSGRVQSASRTVVRRPNQEREPPRVGSWFCLDTAATTSRRCRDFVYTAPSVSSGSASLPWMCDGRSCCLHADLADLAKERSDRLRRFVRVAVVGSVAAQRARDHRWPDALPADPPPGARGCDPATVLADQQPNRHRDG
jgi:hypothetical protein